MLTTTFALLKAAGACTERYKVLAKALGGVDKYGRSTPIPLSRILETNGLQDTLWALGCTTEDARPVAVEFACRAAERALRYFALRFPGDPRPRKAIEAARKCAAGEITKYATYAAADAAASAAADATCAAAAAAAYAATYAAYAATYAAYAAYATEAAEDAAYAATYAAYATHATDAAADAAYAATYAAYATHAPDAAEEHQKQKDDLRELLDAESKREVV
mgnify:CR=1 FL=1